MLCFKNVKNLVFNLSLFAVLIIFFLHIIEDCLLIYINVFAIYSMNFYKMIFDSEENIQRNFQNGDHNVIFFTKK